MMRLEDKYQGVIHSIEFMIVLVYRKNNQLVDRQIIKSLEALVKHYSTLLTKRRLPKVELDELEKEIYDRVVESLDAKELTEGRADKRLNGTSQELTKEKIFLACLQKIEKSAKRWNSRNGQRGYLDVVMNHIG